MNKLVLGDGLLGTEIVRQTGWSYISRKKEGIDFLKPDTYVPFLEDYDEVINCIAYTTTYDTDKELAWKINYEGTANLVDICNQQDKKLTHISTDYLYTHSKENASEEDVPVHCENWYGYTKLLADGYVQLKSQNYLLIRGTHKQSPFPYEVAWADQVGNFDYVSVMAGLMIKLINKNADGVYNVGTETKSMYELAKQTKKTVASSYMMEHASTPRNVTMNLTKMEKKLYDI